MVAKNLSIADLERELTRRQKALAVLGGRRKALLGQVQGVEADIAAIRGTGSGLKRGPGRPRNTAVSKRSAGTKRLGRAKNSVTLPDAIAQAMAKGAVVSPKEVAQFVKANGYKTTSKTFGIQVAGTLSKDNRFKRVGRGQYERVK